MRNNITVRKAESIDGDGAYGDRQNKTWGTVTETFEEIVACYLFTSREKERLIHTA